MHKSFVKYPSFAAFQLEQAKTNSLKQVYDLTEFIDKHPGGRGPLNAHKGKDLENIFFNPSIHKHSQSALFTLEKYKCGYVEQKPQQPMLASKSTGITPSNQSNTFQKKNDKIIEQHKQPPTKSFSVKPKRQNNEERLNQSMSKLNSSMTSSVKSQYLLIPTQQEILIMQKQKQQKLIKQWQQSEIDELKRQQAEIQSMQQNKQYDRKVQSEILVSPRKKPVNPYYQAWLEKQQEQKPQQQIQTNNILPSYLTQSAEQQYQKQPEQSTAQQNQNRYYDSKLSQSVIVEKTQKKVNPYYEEWKRKQSLKEQEQKKEQLLGDSKLQQEQSIILEENESLISGQPSSINNSFQRSYSMMSQRTVVQEDPRVSVPIFAPKFISPIKAKFVTSTSMQKF